MKKYFSKKIVSVLAVVALVLSAGSFAVLQSQNQLTEVYDLLFKTVDPQIRYFGTLSFRTGTGTSIATMSQAGVLAGTVRPVTVGTTGTYKVTAADCGRIYIATATSGTQTYTLPTVASVPGCMLTFIAGHAGGEILIDAAADAQGFVMVQFTAVGADADTGIVTEADGAPGIKNTAGTNAISDQCTFISDGVLTWHGLGICTGIWAAQ